MENKKKLDNLSEEQIDGSTVKGGRGGMRPQPIGGTPGTPGTPDFSAPTHSPENHLPGQTPPDASEPDPTNPTPHPGHPPHHP